MVSVSLMVDLQYAVSAEPYMTAYNADKLEACDLCVEADRLRAMQRAVRFGYLYVMDALLDHRVRQDARDSQGRSLLCYASGTQTWYPEVATRLLRRQSSFPAPSEDGINFMHFFFQSIDDAPVSPDVVASNVKFITLLGCDWNAADESGCTPLTRLSNAFYASLLLDAGADPVAAFCGSRTVHCLFNKSADFVRLLLKRGLAPDSVIHDGRTLRQHAEARQDFKFLDMLAEAHPSLGRRRPAILKK